jgi:hypothetical protein
VTTVARGDDWFVNWADFPALAWHEQLGVATWLRKLGEDVHAYGVERATTADGGASWTEPQLLHGDRSPSEHGFVSLVPLPFGDFQAVWLDGRHTQGDGHGGGPHGAMALYTRTVRVSGPSGDEIQLDGRVCDCCQTDAAVLPDGSLIVVYRDRSESEVRDISYVRGKPGIPGSFSEPRTIHEDGWTFPGCPVNGPAVAARGDRVAVVWFTLGADQVPRVRLALSEDGGQRFSPPFLIDGERALGRVDAAFLEDGTLVISWLARAADGEGAAVWCARPVSPAGLLGESIVVSLTGGERADGFLRLAPCDGGALAAWTAADGLAVARLDVRRSADAPRTAGRAGAGQAAP